MITEAKQCCCFTDLDGIKGKKSIKQGHPTTVFSQMLLNAVLGYLHGVVLKLWRFILGGAKKIYLFGYSRGS